MNTLYIEWNLSMKVGPSLIKLFLSFIFVFNCVSCRSVSVASDVTAVIFLFTEKETWGTPYWLKFLTSLPVPDVSVFSESLCSLLWGIPLEKNYAFIEPKKYWKYVFILHMKILFTVMKISFRIYLRSIRLIWKSVQWATEAMLYDK